MGQDKNYSLYSNIEEKEIEWLWYPYIPLGKITLLQGDPGDGKSTFILNVIACLTTGKPLPDGTVAPVCNAIYQCSEDSQNDTTKPRLIVAGADCDKVAFIEEKNSDAALSIVDERIERAIQAFHAKLLVLDPLQSYIPQDGDMQNAMKMRQMMKRLARVAEKNNCAVVLIGHMTKSSAGKKQLYRGLGSIDIAAIARSILMITRDEDNSGIRYMSQVKNNLAFEGSTIGFLFDSSKGFHWLGKCSLPNMESAMILNRPKAKKEQAREILKVILSAGDVPSSEVYEKTRALDISDRTVKIAKKEMGIHAVKKRNVWYWRYGKPEECFDEDDEI